MHAGGRRKGKARSRILYWFRTPPGVRVGRAALDEDAIRLIEEHNPDVEFDWTRILKGQGVETRPAPPRDRDVRIERGRRSEPRPAPPAVEPVRDVETGLSAVEEPFAEEVAELGTVAIDVASTLLPEPLDDRPVQEAVPDEVHPVTPAHAQIGSEGVSRLRARYAEVLARISERIPDPARQEELKAQAERLNPDTWVTDAEVTTGLENYESAYEALRSVVGGPVRRRRRKRRRGGGQQPPQAAASGGRTNGVDEGGPDDDPNADDQ